MATPYRAFQTYGQAFDYLCGKTQRTVKPNVTIRMDGDDLVVRLYNTDIVRYKPNGDVIVNHGGFATPTTFRHIAGCSPVRAFCKKGVPFAQVGSLVVPFVDEGILYSKSGACELLCSVA